MNQTQAPAPGPAPRLMKLAEHLGRIGFLALFVGPPMALPKPLSAMSFHGIVAASLLGFGAPIGLLFLAFLIAQFAIWLGRRRA